MQMPRFEVPEALVMEILSKLPVKSLTRFNCVCKYWCSFFRTPHFISKHYHNNVKNNNLNLVLQRHDHGTANMPYFSQSSNQLPYVYGARHGLFCLYDCLTDKAAIWNPSTREFKILSPSSVQAILMPFSVSPIPKFFESYREHYIQVLKELTNLLIYGL
ncbi:hypothetical protein E1A91_D10G277900v1 [Gossypium mustelinum]|uniref:F-box domain-containing protein n=1 Tax=Gossypium mustelinum TaxID=34275 RepID=A0A5D2TD38_GOSMU|nr:hypothetical protein E1A91_D10G277900v1 [Gossypium mustelinum]